MPKDLEGIVQSMIDAGESEDDIAGVIKHYKANPPVPEPLTPADNKGPYMGPDNFATGVVNSIMSGEAPMASLKGAMGFARGAVADLPGSIVNGLTSMGNAIAHPIDTITNAPRDLMNMGRGMVNTTMQAGSHPEEFGRMMGQMTGQPLVTAGVVKGAPLAANLAKTGTGMALETGGGIMRKYQPISGMIPKIMEPRILRTIEKNMGRGIEGLGRQMQETPVKPSSKTMPKIVDGEIVSVRESPTNSPKLLKESRTDRYHGNPERKGLPPVTDIGESRPIGTKPRPKTGSGPFEMKGEVLKDLDSRISGIAPDETPKRLGPPSAAVNRYASSTGPNLLDELRHQANKYGMTVEDYIASLRKGGGENFVMPSAEMPRVR